MNIKLSLVFLFTLTVTFASAQRILSRQDYIDTYAYYAVEEMYRSGVPASITLAQGCLESGNGNSELSQKSNNHFGIKCHGWSGKGVRYNDDAPNECFRKYDSVADSYADHSDFLSANQRYASLFQLRITDYKGWARGLKKAGYATDPRYADKLITIIQSNELYRYDKMTPKELNKYQKSHPSTTTTSNSAYTSQPATKTEAITLTRNGCLAAVVQAGDSPQKIADRYHLKLWEIYKYNDFADSHIITVGEIIYLERKKKRTDKNHRYYTVRPGDSMHSISQQFGVRLKNLYKLNRMDGTDQISVGDKINLYRKK